MTEELKPLPARALLEATLAYVTAAGITPDDLASFKLALDAKETADEQMREDPEGEQMTGLRWLDMLQDDGDMPVDWGVNLLDRAVQMSTEWGL